MISQVPRSSKIAMTMRKIGFIAALVVAMTAVSCVQEMNTEIPAPETSAVTFDATFDASATKAVLDGTTGKVAWETDDQVSILVGDGNYLYTATQGGATTTLTTQAEGVPSEGTYYAVFPYDEAAAMAGENLIATTLPAEQIAVLGSFTTHLAVAQTTGNKLAFKNVCGLVKVNVSAENVTKIVFEGNNEEIVAGDIEVTVSDTPSWERLGGDPDPASLASVRSTPVASTSVTLVPAEGQTILAKGDYYFAVLPQTFTNGFKVTAYKGDEASVIRNVITEVVIARAGMIAGKSFGIDGSGTEDDPYILKTPQDMVDMRSLAKLGGETWFKMANSIDMKGVDWVPVNYDQNFERKIHFDGGDFTISNLTSDKSVHGANYPSFMGVVYGSVKNLKFDNAVIKSTSGCGVVGGYVGTTNKPAVVENVTITNSSVTNSGERCGGVCGTAKEATFKNVSFQGTVTSTFVGEAKSGGFVGQTETSATFEDCNADVVFTGAGTDIGGFAGKLLNNNSFKSCKVKVTITSSAAQKNRCGGFLGWNASANATFDDCHVLSGSSVKNVSGGTTSVNGNFGGFIGFGDTTDSVVEIKNCSAQADVDGGVTAYNSCFVSSFGYLSTVTITDSYAKGYLKSSTGNYTGGLVGYSQNAEAVLKISGCHYEGNIEATGGYVGGLVGGASGKVEIKDSYSSGVVASNSKYVGGLIGASQNDNVVIEGCYSSSAVSSPSEQVGGLVGTTTNKIAISGSYSTGEVSGANYTAGLIGIVKKESTIQRCWSSAEVTSTGQRVGGMVGETQAQLTIADCFSTGNITATGQQVAGILGYASQKVIVERCYSTGDITSNTAGTGGIVGTLAGASSEVSDCIAWNENIICNRTANNKWAPGAVVGAANTTVTLADCYRRADMNFYDKAGAMTLSDQDNVTNAVPPTPAYLDNVTQAAYHGKAAGAEETLSQVALRIGWSEDIWDLSGDVPALK